MALLKDIQKNINNSETAMHEVNQAKAEYVNTLGEFYENAISLLEEEGYEDRIIRFDMDWEADVRPLHLKGQYQDALFEMVEIAHRYFEE